MSVARHPRDSAGLPLPDGSWPDAVGSAGQLEPVRRFCNSCNREHGADAWRTPAELQAWMRAEGYRDAAVSPATHRDVLALRDAVWALIRNRDGTALAAQLPRWRLTLTLDAGGSLTVTSTVLGASEMVADLVGRIFGAQNAGTWDRLKACNHCGWVFYDTSKNRSGRWCTMSACGARHKARQYRLRRVQPARNAATRADRLR